MTDLLSSVIAAHGGLDRWHTVRAIDVTQKGDVLANDRTYAMWAACDCGTCVVEAKQAPMVRFNCHCTICQAFTGDAYSDMMVVPASRAVVKTKTGSTTRSTRSFASPRRTSVAVAAESAESPSSKRGASDGTTSSCSYGLPGSSGRNCFRHRKRTCFMNTASETSTTASPSTKAILPASGLWRR
jgi:hypothetical protein